MDTSENLVLCAASAYDRKYYLNPRFSGLPDRVKKELKIMSVLMTERTGGTFSVRFSPEGELLLETAGREDDYFYDDIGAGLEIGELRREKRELFEQLELYYRVVFKRRSRSECLNGQ